MLALAFALSFIQTPEMPFGGNISLAALPLVVFAMRHGVKSGAFTGLLFGVLNAIFHPTHGGIIGSIVLDFLVAGTAFGLAGAFSKWYLGLALAYVVNYLAHFFSGVLFFGQYAPESQGVWLYSLIYNASYVVPEAIVLFVAVFALKKWSRLFEKKDV